MTSLRQVISNYDIDTCVSILRSSFGTVAEEFGLTEKNTPSNAAFITTENLKKQISENRTFYLLDIQNNSVGTVAIEKSTDQPGTFFIEKLAVLPAFRHKGFGKELMEFATRMIIDRGGKKVSVAVINENTQLKTWYESQGFIQTSLRKFDHLLFTVCFMHKILG